MRIALLNPMKYSLLITKLCLCALVFLYAISTSANTETIISEPVSANIADNKEQPRLSLSDNLDWVKKQDMTPEQQSLVAKFCCGAYIEPKRDYQDSDKHPA